MKKIYALFVSAMLSACVAKGGKSSEEFFPKAEIMDKCGFYILKQDKEALVLRNVGSGSVYSVTNITGSGRKGKAVFVLVTSTDGEGRKTYYCAGADKKGERVSFMSYPLEGHFPKAGDLTMELAADVGLALFSLNGEGGSSEPANASGVKKALVP